MVGYRDTTIKDETIVLDKHPEDLYQFLGPNLILKNCTLVIKLSANALGIQTLQMEGGRFEQKKQLTNVQLNTCHFDGVTFTGSFSGVDFGWWNDDKDASIKNCDFSHAKLKGVRFLQTDLSTIVLPEAPGFSFTINKKHLSEFQIPEEWPRKLKSYVRTAANSVDGCSLVAYDAHDIAKSSKTTPEYVLECLSEVPGFKLGND